MPKFLFNTDFDFDFFHRIPISPFLLFSRTKAVSLSYSTLLLLQMTRRCSSSHLELLLYHLLWLLKISPPPSQKRFDAVYGQCEPSVSLLKDSTNQPEQAKRLLKLSAILIKRRLERSVLARCVAVETRFSSIFGLWIARSSIQVWIYQAAEDWSPFYPCLTAQ